MEALILRVNFGGSGFSGYREEWAQRSPKKEKNLGL